MVSLSGWLDWEGREEERYEEGKKRDGITQEGMKKRERNAQRFPLFFYFYFYFLLFYTFIHFSFPLPSPPKGVNSALVELIAKPFLDQKMYENMDKKLPNVPQGRHSRHNHQAPPRDRRQESDPPDSTSHASTATEVLAVAKATSLKK